MEALSLCRRVGAAQEFPLCLGLDSLVDLQLTRLGTADIDAEISSFSRRNARIFDVTSD
jgi:hypothetical protein